MTGSTVHDRHAITAALIERAAIAVVRLDDASHGEALVQALRAGGVTAIEITLTTPGATALMAKLRQSGGHDLLIGAGSVLSADAARQAIDAGAQFIVSPVFDAHVLATAHASGVPALPGAYTPTEIFRAHDAGADIVKVFPSDAVGPSYLKALLAPMPFLQLMPTGGVTPENAGAWISAGAVAVGLGSALVDPALVRAGDFATISARAHLATTAIASARAAR